jgi:hypothetical protein
MSSEEHDELQRNAVVWLKQQGFTNVMTEVKVIIEGELAGTMAPGKGNRYGTTLTPDVIGINGTRKAVIECGSIIPLDRLYKFQSLGFEVYIWPFDALEPYLWSEDVCLCRFCGRRFERAKFIK